MKPGRAVRTGAAHPWLVPVTTLRRSHGARREEHRSGPVGELLVASSAVPAGATAEADVVLESVEGGIEVEGWVSAPWQGECRRCLRPVSGVLRTRVREVYLAPHRSEPEDGEDSYPLTSDQLDLEPLVRDALLLELPIAPLCREDCLGLCPDCGADRNAGPCGCAPPASDPRWGALDVLRSPPGEELGGPSE